MEKQKKEFDIAPKHNSKEELRRWRKSVMPVKNHHRRFRYVANLDKRLEAEEMKAKISVSDFFVFLNIRKYLLQIEKMKM